MRIRFIFLVITIILAVIGFLFFWLYIPLEEIAQFFQIIQVFIVTFTLFYISIQANETLRTRKLQSTTELIKEIGSEEIRKLRHWVLYNISTIPSVIDEKDNWDARRIAVVYDRVGFMLKQKLIQEEAIFYLQRDVIEVLWKKLEPIICSERDRRENYCENFEHLATKWLPKMNKRERRKKWLRSLLPISR